MTETEGKARTRKGDWPNRPKFKQCKRCWKKYRTTRDYMGMVQSKLCPHEEMFP